jgi:hypothetical protein
MNNVFASLDLATVAEIDVISPHGLGISRQGTLLQFDIDDPSSGLTLDTVYAAMQWVEQSAVPRHVRLIWSFSSIAVPVAEVRRLLDCWDETGEPPLLSIIALELGDYRHVTRGTAAFIA